VSCQSPNCDAHNYLTEATQNLVQTFAAKNNCYPKRIIIFRDGLSEGQFKMLEGEIIAIKAGLEMCDMNPQTGKTCPIAMIVCQKRHNTRLFYRYYNSLSLNHVLTSLDYYYH